MSTRQRRPSPSDGGRSAIVRPQLVEFETREVPAMLVGLTTTDSLVMVDSAAPGTILSSTPITGLQVGESLVGIDYRPATNELFGIGSLSRVYTLNATTGVATQVGAGPFSPALAGTEFAVDFNPAADRIRVVSNTTTSIRLNPSTGAVAGTDTPVVYDATSYADYFAGPAPAAQIVAGAYTKNADPVSGATVTTLYVLDANLDVLATQGGPDSNPSPNLGQLFIVSPLSFNVTASSGFDIEAGSDAAFVSTFNGTATTLYSLNLTTGASTTLGTFGSQLVEDITIAPAPAGSGLLGLSASAYAFLPNRNPIAVTINRTGGATGPATVNYATANGTAIAGTDYLASSGTATFANGQTSTQIFLSLVSGTPAISPAKTFTIALSTPGGGATLGANNTATITIPAVTAAAPVTRLVATGAGAGGGPAVNVFNPANGQSIATFFAYESTFTGGVTVATGDVNGDGTDDVIVGTGVGGGPRVRVFDGTKLATPTTAVFADFFAYESTFTGGVNVAVGDVDGDGFADVIIGSGVGGGPRVRVIDAATITATVPPALFDFFAYEDTFRGGVNVGAGEYNNDGKADILAGAGFGGGPRVRILSGANLTPLADYFAYDSAFRSGVLVAAGDVNGDAVTDVITGAGPGGGPNVRAFSGITTTTVSNFFAYNSALRGGVRVSSADYNADGIAEIVTTSGPGGPSSLRFYGANGVLAFETNAFDPSFTGGVFVG